MMIVYEKKCFGQTILTEFEKNSNNNYNKTIPRSVSSECSSYKVKMFQLLTQCDLVVYE